MGDLLRDVLALVDMAENVEEDGGLDAVVRDGGNTK